MDSLAKPGGSYDVLQPNGELDVLPYYGQIAAKLTGFLHGRELASRVRAPRGRISSVVISGLTSPPLYIRQIARAVTPELIRARNMYKNMDDARHILSPDQQLTWSYFPKRRYIGFDYATNRLGPARDIDRVVYDVDRCTGSALTDLIKVVQTFLEVILSDDHYPALFKGDPLVCWTGNSFQVMLFTRELQPASFYPTHVVYTGKGSTLSDRWIDSAARVGTTKIAGGSQRRRGFVLLDASRTPSGKLSPVPLGSIRMASATALEGVSVPLLPDMLENDLLTDLITYTPERVLDELDELAARLPVKNY